jgi:MFS family permease
MNTTRLVASIFSPASNHRLQRLRADLRASCSDGAAFGGMVGVGETYLPAFVLAVGLGELVAGMVGSIPLLAGGLIQMISPTAVRLLRSHKRWVVLCATVQALTFVPLVVAAWRGSISGVAIILVASLYWGAGLAAGPAWNTWIGTIVPQAVRPRFFSIRARASQATVFLGFLAGGLGLQYAAVHDGVLITFAVLFLVAALCRLISAWMLARQSEPTPIPANMRQIPWTKLWRHLRQHSGGQLLIYLVAVQASVQVSGPFFTPFMFQKLGLSYGQFVALISVAFMVKMFALPIWGGIAHKLGARRLLWIGGVGIVPLSVGWLVSQNYYWLLVLQVTGGVTWAAYELAFFLLFFESIAEEERTSLLTLYNLINTMAWVAGALVGGLLLYLSGTTYNAYLMIFTLSSAGRCLALLLLARLPAMEAVVEEVSVRPVAVRPNSASLDAPILPSLPDQIPMAVEV